MIHLLLLAAATVATLPVAQPTPEARAAFWRDRTAASEALLELRAQPAYVALEAAQRKLNDTIGALCVAPAKVAIVDAKSEPTCVAPPPAATESAKPKGTAQ